MEDRAIEFLMAARKAMFGRDFEQLAKILTVPWVVYTPVGVLVVENEEMQRLVIDRFTDALSALDIATGHALVIDKSEPGTDRLRITIQWVELDADDRPVAGSRVRYFLVAANPVVTGHPWKIEMLEFIELPLPIDDVKNIIH